MGWFKKLKKKISIKNIVKGVKKAAGILPGGTLIQEGISTAESAFAKAGGKATPALEKPIAGAGFNNPILIGVAAIALYFLIVKGKK